MKIAFALFAFLFFIRISDAQNLDINLLKDINGDSSQLADKVFTFESSTTYLVCIGVPLVQYAAGIFEKNCDLKNDGIITGLSLITTTILTQGLKSTVNRPRPYVTYPFIVEKGNNSSPSFPSSHASTSFSTATSLALQYPYWYVIAPAFLWASSVAYSRMYLGEHYPSDAIAGALLGSGSALLCRQLNKWINRPAR